MLRANGEFIVACIGCENRSFPTDGKLIRVELVRLRPALAEIELNFRVQPCQYAITIAKSPSLEIPALQPVLISCLGRGPERRHQVRDGVAILAHREPRQLDPRRLVSSLRQR